MLVDWVNPMYLDTGVVKDIRARFKDESEIQLQEFLLVNSCHHFAIGNSVKQTTTATGTSPNKRFKEQNNSCARAL